MPTERETLLIICALGCVSYSLRAGGYLAASLFPADGTWARVLKLAPGNLFVAFIAVGLWHGDWPVLAGSLSTLVTMKLTHREWAALGVGFAVVALATVATGTSTLR
jgi:uncharacterized membrane protein